MNSCKRKPWLYLIGIGENGRGGLTPQAKTALAQARLVIGGQRHLELAGPLATETLVWPIPLQNAFPRLLEHRSDIVCVLASGDPFHYGIGALLSEIVDCEEIISLPQPSAFSLVANRLGWLLQNCVCLSVHGRPMSLIRPHLHPGARIIALSWNERTPCALGAYLTEYGFGPSLMHIGEHLGGPKELWRTIRAKEASNISKISALNSIALDLAIDSQAQWLPLTPGLPDDMFQHDGQITKSDVRTITLAALQPFPGALLWDVGSGSGSIAIEWMLRHPMNRAIAIEQNVERAKRIRNNADNIGVPALQVQIDAAPEVFSHLSAPDAIFIGGGISQPQMIEAAWAHLKSKGRLAMNAATLEGQSYLTDWHNRFEGEMVQIQIAQAKKLGRFHGFRPAMPIIQWRGRKP